jgi:hypothetical protein
MSEYSIHTELPALDLELRPEDTVASGPLALGGAQQEEALSQEDVRESAILSFEALFPDETPEDIFRDKPEVQQVLQSEGPEAGLVKQLLTVAVCAKIIEAMALVAGNYPQSNGERINTLQDILQSVENGQVHSLDWFSTQTGISRQEFIDQMADRVENYLHKIHRFS